MHIVAIGEILWDVVGVDEYLGGTLLNTHTCAHATTRRLLDVLPSTPQFYDVNLRKDSYSRQLLAQLL